ncbi:MAG: glycine cleavage system protein GcvH [Coriobacteriia bacterium]|nr:glycine cleavage system protein GcvH [Coriobacteriia bacterium]
MAYPNNLKYTKSHEWLLEEDGVFALGLTDYAQDQMGDIVFVELPEVDDEVEAGSAFAETESVKAVSEIFSPVDGKVVEVNEELEDEPSMLNSDPHNTWIVKFEGELSEELMNAEEYQKFIEEQD